MAQPAFEKIAIYSARIVPVLYQRALLFFLLSLEISILLFFSIPAPLLERFAPSLLLQSESLPLPVTTPTVRFPQSFLPALLCRPFRPRTPTAPLCRPYLPSTTSFVLFKLTSSVSALSSLSAVCHSPQIPTSVSAPLALLSSPSLSSSTAVLQSLHFEELQSSATTSNNFVTIHKQEIASIVGKMKKLKQVGFVSLLCPATRSSGQDFGAQVFAAKSFLEFNRFCPRIINRKGA
ncbi:hypothetical protein FCM35_KLT06784 [Carex littledalei]|uniref:Uncharacterized protein n=1 Tax=Carex littledalei TaxID=544730 RepID=A0A833R0R8_9POAL|nr:hypothetical protein FCM35_KLT06784 [Carex littledalei]